MANKIVLITGASSGIGLATANLLHEAGYKVYGTSRRPNSGLVTGFHLIELDVTNASSVSRAVQHVIAQEGRIDVLINNAGFAIAPAGAEESSIQQAQLLFETNFFGVMRMTQAVIPFMRQEKSGLILNISSVLGLIPMPFNALYSASKHAIEGYSESLDHELRSQGVRVSLIEPAYTNTSLDEHLLEADNKLDLYNSMRVKAHHQMVQSIRNSDRPITIARVILSLLNDKNLQTRYPAGKTAKFLTKLRRFAPAMIFDKMIQRNLYK